MSELKETKKIKVFPLYEQTTKQFEPEPNSKNCQFFVQQSQKKLPINQIKLKAKIDGDIENVCCSVTYIDLKHILNHKPNPMKAQFLPLFNVN